MFSFFKQQPRGEKVTFKINGMHCTSCSLNIDGELEDTEGVISAETSYAQAKTVIHWDSKKVNLEQLKAVVESLGYSVTI